MQSVGKIVVASGPVVSTGLKAYGRRIVDYNCLDSKHLNSAFQLVMIRQIMMDILALVISDFFLILKTSGILLHHKRVLSLIQ